VTLVNGGCDDIFKRITSFLADGLRLLMDRNNHSQWIPDVLKP
jgi:hypothetical protein